MKTGFTVKGVTVRAGRFRYRTFRLSGWLNGGRIRRQFADRAEAEGEKARLEVEAANGDSGTRAINTRLTSAQVATAEAAYALLGGRPLLTAVEWFLANYRSPVVETPIDVARDAFLADRTPHVSAVALRDYTRTLRDFIAFCGKDPTAAADASFRPVHFFKAEHVAAFLNAPRPRGPIGPKTFNNARTNLNAFFNFCASPARKWATENPVAAVPKFKVARGLPEIISPAKAAELMAFVETYDGGPRRRLQPGCLAPYFALCLFAGIRPSARDGEIRKLADSPDCVKLVDVANGVIRITPSISKTCDLRSIKIRPNLIAWLKRYPLDRFPIVMPGLQDMVTEVRKKLGLGDDVMRHTYISAHVAKFRSLGDAALEAGNSEAMIRKHYLNLLTESEATAFWAIVPRRRRKA